MDGINFAEILAFMVILVGSLSVHEAAHAWAADRLGDPTARALGRLSLNPAVHVDPIGTVFFPLLAAMTNLPLIGWARPVPVDRRYLRAPHRDFALIAAAGPVSNLVLAALGSGAVLALGGLGAVLEAGMLGETLVQWVVLNVLLALFNMIPVPPLDGGNVLMGLLPSGAADALERLRPYGFLVIYALMLSGLLSAVLRPVQRLILGGLL
ncbi:MAG: site-2 protease family protein [Acidobacteria bacterium]|nr:site-2 protease family protein [Acidobacteriota bacterium]